MQIYIFFFIVHKGKKTLLKVTDIHKSTFYWPELFDTVSAALGKDATLSCQLLETKVVSQVTWQKVSGNTEKNICTYSEKFGSSVYPEYKDKIQFTEAGSQKSSIVIRNVTEQDAGCYRCLFTTFPDGNLIGRTSQIYFSAESLDFLRKHQLSETIPSWSARRLFWEALTGVSVTLENQLKCEVKHF
uniref:Ig-like domain-containing protein n=1 Tax=Poecilia latipinna TaxID=48699 RepID=A0A3B3V1R4_9TELE